MKKLIIITALAMLAVSNAHAQGTVTFANGTAIRVFMPDGTTPVAASLGYRAELVYAPDGSPMDQFNNLAVRLGADTAVGVPTAGLYSGGGRTAPTATPGGFGLFQVRVWRAADGPDWRAVMATGDSRFLVGESLVMRIDTGDPTTVPPGTPTPIVGNGLTAIILHPVPEPSVVVLSLVSAAAFILLRRRKITS